MIRGIAVATIVISRATRKIERMRATMMKASLNAGGESEVPILFKVSMSWAFSVEVSSGLGLCGSG